MALDSETALAVISSVAEESLISGMSADLSEFSIKFDASGNANVTGVGADGEKYSGSVSAETIAASLGEELSEEPAEGEDPASADTDSKAHAPAAS